jgi:hypothetical protein
MERLLGVNNLFGRACHPGRKKVIAFLFDLDRIGSLPPLTESGVRTGFGT